MKKLSSQKISETEIVEILNLLKIPFSGTTIGTHHISPFPQASISGIGPIFYLNRKDQKIYTLLQRRFKDNFQWWFPGGYVELPYRSGFFKENFDKIKKATIGEFYNTKDWQKSWKNLNDPKELNKIFKKHKINWPKEIDANWQAAWQREVLEEAGIDLNKYPKAIILNLRISKTFMLGAEPDRLINIDGKFCAFLGDLDKEPKTTPDNEVEESRWIALEDIIFDGKKGKYFAFKNLVNPYVVSLIEESLYEIVSHKIKEISKIKNPLTKQKISRFNSPQNLQAFIISNPKIRTTKEVKEFLILKFGELEISQNLCGINGYILYQVTLKVLNQINNLK